MSSSRERLERHLQHTNARTLCEVLLAELWRAHKAVEHAEAMASVQIEHEPPNTPDRVEVWCKARTYYRDVLKEKRT